MLLTKDLSLMRVSENQETGCVFFIGKAEYHPSLMNFETFSSLVLELESMKSGQIMHRFEAGDLVGDSEGWPENLIQAGRVALKKLIVPSTVLGCSIHLDHH